MPDEPSGYPGYFTVSPEHLAQAAHLILGFTGSNTESGLSYELRKSLDLFTIQYFMGFGRGYSFHMPVLDWVPDPHRKDWTESENPLTSWYINYKRQLKRNPTLAQVPVPCNLDAWTRSSTQTLIGRYRSFFKPNWIEQGSPNMRRTCLRETQAHFKTVRAIIVLSREEADGINNEVVKGYQSAMFDAANMRGVPSYETYKTNFGRAVSSASPTYKAVCRAECVLLNSMPFQVVQEAMLRALRTAIKLPGDLFEIRLLEYDGKSKERYALAIRTVNQWPIIEAIQLESDGKGWL